MRGLFWFDYFLLFDFFAGDVVCKDDLDVQGLFWIFDFVGDVEGESVIGGYHRGKPELFQLIGPYVPLAEPGLVLVIVQVPEFYIHGAVGLEYIALFVNRLYIDNQLFLFTVFVFVVKVCISGNLDLLDGLEIFDLDSVGQAGEGLVAVP